MHPVKHKLESIFPLFGKCLSPRQRRWISLIVAAVALISSSGWSTSSIWQSAMRAKVNQTETQANLMATLGNLGGMVGGLPAGIIYEYFGAQVTSVLGGVLGGVGFVGLSIGTSSVYWREIFSAQDWLVYIFYFLTGSGAAMTYMTTMISSMENFHGHNRGKVVGILDASISGGPVLFSVIYNTLFTNGHTETGEEGLQNLSGFFLMLAIFFSTMSIFLLLFTGPIREPGEENADDEVVLIAEGDEEETKFSEYPFKHFRIWEIVPTFTYFFLVGQMALASNLQLTYQSNIPTYLHSFDFTRYNLLFTIMNTLLQTISKFVAGLISDLVAKRANYPRSIVFLIPYACQTLVLFLSIWFGDNFYMMLVTCVFVGMAYGTCWCQFPVLLGEIFGQKHLPSNLSWSGLVSGALSKPNVLNLHLFCLFNIFLFH